MVTPGVLVLSVAVMPFAVAAPMLVSGTRSFQDSFGSMFASPSPESCVNVGVPADRKACGVAPTDCSAGVGMTMP